MADETTNSKGAAESAAPAATAPVQVQPQQQQSKGQQQMPKNNKNKNRHGSEKSVLDRARRLANAEVAKKLERVSKALGLDKFDEKALEAKLAETEKARASGQSPSERVEQEMREFKSELQKLRDENQKLRGGSKEAEKRARRAESKIRELKADAEITEAARAAGVRNTKYATHLFAEHVASLADPTAPVDAKAFFESLKKDSENKFLFAQETVPAGPQPQAPRAPSPQPPNAPAAPAANDDDVMAADADGKLKMSRREFTRRTQEKYGVALPYA